MDAGRWAGCFFDGHWQATGNTCAVTDKASGEVLAQIGLASAGDLAAAARAAAAAQTAWAETAPDERAAILRRAAQLVERHLDELADWIMRESGGLRAKADTELRSTLTTLHAAAAMMGEPNGLMLPTHNGRMSFARRVPHGVVGVIAPFNFPLTLSIRAVAPALVTGNAVILKPDPQTAVCGGVLIARIFEAAGLPAGLLHVLPGGAEVGEAMCTDPHIGMVAFTGSTAAGRKVGALCGANLKKVSLELGGKNSLIVLDDADLDAAASGAAFGAWMHQGQICMATGRILVSEKIADALAERLVAKANRLPVGDPWREKVALGPVINERQVRGIHAIVQDSVAAGAALLAGGTHEGLYYRPTVLSKVRPGMRSFDEEVFGPVASITTFASDDEAVELANRTDYGLAAAVMSPNTARALALGKRLKVGLLHINDQTVLGDPHIPYGGRGQSGNGSRIGGPANWDEFTQWQWITLRDAPPPYPF
ncbi:MAG: aldehyde dehydrogenase family protein [Ramlibacter sp.]|nr:aldehyde dehydrogenase family protein [Ramlibacter sp.]